MTKNSLTSKQQQAVLDALHALEYSEMKMQEYQRAHEVWIQEFNFIWDNNDGDGPMWAEFERLRNGK